MKDYFFFDRGAINLDTLLRPELPEQKPLYIIGDVHGCFNTMIALINQLPKDAELCFVGDLVDRGPDSDLIIQYIIDHGHHCVLGNHELMMIDYQPPGPYGGTSEWFKNGGYETMSCYKDFDVFIRHRDWLASLPLYIEFKDRTIKTDKERTLVVSHSSIAKIWDNIQTINRDKAYNHVLWNRDVKDDAIPSKPAIFNVFGHTPRSNVVIKEHYACVDSGCVYKKEKYNRLVALEFPSMKVFSQANIESGRE